MRRNLLDPLHTLGKLVLVLALAGCSRSPGPPRSTVAPTGDALLPFAVEDVRYCSDIWSWNDEDMGTPLMSGVLDACGVALDASSLRVIGQMVRTDGSDERCDKTLLVRQSSNTTGSKSATRRRANSEPSADRRSWSRGALEPRRG
jgi:hypothetical protein